MNYNHETQQTTELIKEFDVEPEVLERLGLPELPDGYGLIGGAARAVALRVLFDETSPIRDIDIAAFEDLKPDLELAMQLAEEYMPDDLTYGHGVQEVNLEEYFKSRDLTINELAVVDGKLRISKQCFDDLRDKVVRPSKFEQYEEDGKIFVGPKTATKCLLMQSVFETHFGKSELADVDDVSFTEVSDFYIALGLNKAFQYGTAVTGHFANQLFKKGILSLESDRNPYKLAEELQSYVLFVFRGSDISDRLQEYIDTPSVDLLSPFHDVSGDWDESRKANEYVGRGQQWIGKNEY